MVDSSAASLQRSCVQQNGMHCLLLNRHGIAAMCNLKRLIKQCNMQNPCLGNGSWAAVAETRPEREP